jgi:hypothetical protein
MADKRFGRSMLVLVTVVGLSAALSPAPLRADDATCPANAPAADPGTQPILTALTAVLNNLWASKATGTIDPLAYKSGNLTAACPSDGGTECFFSTGLTNCEHTTFHVNFSSLTGLGTLKFSEVDVTAFDFKDVAQHSSPGPDAGKVTDGVYAPEGSSWQDAQYAVLLPFTGPQYGLTVDLGKVVTICAGMGCGPKIQANFPKGGAQYELDYSTDGVTWTSIGNAFITSGGNLRTTALNVLSPATFSARYVRVWASAGDGNYSISEIELQNSAGAPVSRGAQAIGPRPAQIVSGGPPADGTAWNDPRAVQLAKEGPAHALVIDLGALVNICGNGYQCWNAPVIQADHNDIYQLDYSTDGVNWTTLDQFPTESGSGLRTRNIGCNLRPDPSQPCSSTNHNPNFTARYVRVWAVSGDGSYSVSQLDLWNSSSVLVSTGILTYGPEPLLTNGELAPEGTNWNDGRYARVLSSCTNTNNTSTRCVTSAAKSAAATIDLGATFPISQLRIQADHNDTYQVDSSTDGTSWTQLWAAPTISGNGLTSRTSPTFNNPQVRYLRVYATSGDGSFSVSALEAFTAKARTACSYDAGANAQQGFSCTYEGPFTTSVDLPPAGLVISYTVDETCANLRCTTPGIASGSTPSTCYRGAKCTATLTAKPGSVPTGAFCSGACTSGPSVLTYGQLGQDAIEFELNNPQCDQSLGSLGPAVQGVVQGATAAAAQALFDAFLSPPAVPSALAPTYQAPYYCQAPAALPPPGTPPPDTGAVLEGLAKHVGSDKDNATLRITGTFMAPDSIELDHSTVLVDGLLHALGGQGELVTRPDGALLVPLGLEPQHGSKPDKGKYASPPGTKPAVRAKIAPVKGHQARDGFMEFSLTVEHATIRGPVGCAEGSPVTAPLITSFHLGGSAEPALWVHAATTWQCLGSSLATP